MVRWQAPEHPENAVRDWNKWSAVCPESRALVAAEQFSFREAGGTDEFDGRQPREIMLKIFRHDDGNFMDAKRMYTATPNVSLGKEWLTQTSFLRQIVIKGRKGKQLWACPSN